MTRVAVVAHAGKTIGGGLVELRRVLEEAGVGDPLWYEVPKSRKAPKQVKRALEEGAELVLRVGRRRHRPALHRRARGHGDAARDRPRRHRQPARHQPRHPEGHRGCRGHRAPRRATRDRRRPDERGAVRRDGRRRPRRRDDPRRRRRAQGPRRAHRLRLDGRPQHQGEALQGEDPRRRRHLVRRPDELHPRRQRRQPLRRDRGVRRRAARRRDARARRRDRGEADRVGAHDRPDRGRHDRQVAVRPDHPRAARSR